MADLTLIIADKNYCLWPLPAWLCLRGCGLEFDEILIRFEQIDTREQMLKYGPTGRVPVLKHGDLTIWDSLAICEYVNELAPHAGLWPDDRAARAVARSVSAELHGTGGSYPGSPRHIIYALNTNVRRQPKPIALSAQVQESIDHIVATWLSCRTQYGANGPFLFGRFTIADAMSAHMANRFVSYGVTLPEQAQAYCQALRAYPPMQEWIAAAMAEDWILASAEIDTPASAAISGSDMQ